jgi:hypothetical protein
MIIYAPCVRRIPAANSRRWLKGKIVIKRTIYDQEDGSVVGIAYPDAMSG